jgi:hypothetical protein
VVDVEEDPSEDSGAAAAFFALVLVILVQKCLWSGPFFF